MTGKVVRDGYVYYAQNNQRQLVEISDDLRQQTINTINDVTRIIATGIMPQAVYSKRCKGCSLSEQCLPKLVDKVGKYIESED